MCVWCIFCAPMCVCVGEDVSVRCVCQRVPLKESKFALNENFLDGILEG